MGEGGGGGGGGNRGARPYVGGQLKQKDLHILPHTYPKRKYLPKITTVMASRFELGPSWLKIG